jgi:hypothetical protein
VGTWHDPGLGRPIAAPLERCAELLGVDLVRLREPAAKVERYIRAEGTRVWSLMQLERQLRPRPTAGGGAATSTIDGSQPPTQETATSWWMRTLAPRTPSVSALSTRVAIVDCSQRTSHDRTGSARPPGLDELDPIDDRGRVESLSLLPRHVAAAIP